MHNEICNCLVNLKINHKIGNSNYCISNDELVTMCRDCGKLFYLFYNVFAIINKMRHSRRRHYQNLFGSLAVSSQKMETDEFDYHTQIASHTCAHNATNKALQRRVTH